MDKIIENRQSPLMLSCINVVQATEQGKLYQTFIDGHRGFHLKWIKQTRQLAKKYCVRHRGIETVGSMVWHNRHARNCC